MRSLIALFDWGREQGRFEGSTEGARASNTGARESTQGHAYLGAFYQAGRSKWEPELAALSPALVAYFILGPTVGHLVLRLNVVQRRNKWEPELATILYSG